MDAFWVLMCCQYGCSLGIDALKQEGIDVNVGASVHAVSGGMSDKYDRDPSL